MCGICGVFNLQLNTRLTESQLHGMNSTLQHRGPDDAGVWLSADGQIGLANRRLAIIDLSPAGHQPMSNEDGTVWITYNGEVYNFVALREGLEQAGHRFRSHTDTETILHLYEEEGDDLVHRLRGMFAFGLWDSKRRRLLLARDRLGIKPLYYAVTQGRLLFASEIKALFASGWLRPKINRQAVPQYLALGHVPAPETLFEGVQKLEPGHLLIADTDGLHIRRYWDLYQGTTTADGGSTGEYEERTLAKLEEAVRIRLVADVPVGVFLSGGIDSSLVAALAARRVADYLGAEAHEILIGADDVRAFFPRFVDFQEEPVSNPIWFATYFVSKLARDNGVIVMLSGDGGDELFAGYNRWMEYLRVYERGWRQLRAMPALARQLVGGLAQSFLPRDEQREIVRRAVAGEEMFWGGTAFKPAQLAAMLAPDLQPNGSLWECLPIRRWRQAFEESTRGRPTDYLEWMTYASLKGNLLEDFLMRLDKMGMAASIEGRVPMLDHEFIALSLSIPPQLKYPGYRNKHLLREIARRLLPDDVVDRRKTGFCAPVEVWLGEAFAPQLADGLFQLQARERLFDPAWISQTLNGIKNGSGLTARYWALLALGQWHVRWLAR